MKKKCQRKSEFLKQGDISFSGYGWVRCRQAGESPASNGIQHNRVSNPPLLHVSILKFSVSVKKPVELVVNICSGFFGYESGRKADTPNEHAETKASLRFVNAPLLHILLCCVFSRDGKMKFKYGGQNTKDGLVDFIRK